MLRIVAVRGRPADRSSLDTMPMPSDPDPTLVDALRRLLERRTGQPVERVETHISWVLLTATEAYKLKKPLRLPFLDFGSVEARRRCCEEELRINRRFAPMLYLDVVPVRGTPAAPTLDGGGTPIDHLVRMRRFPEAALLRELVTTRHVRPEWLDTLAARLAALHAQAPRAAPDSPFGGPERTLRAATDVLDRLEQLEQLEHQRRPGPVTGEGRLATLRAWVRAQATALRPVWLARRVEGAIRACHGDLHLANIVWLDGMLTPFDAIEFDPALRWIDIVADLAFLTMDLKAHGRADLAARVLDAWLQSSGDYAGLGVLGFHEVQRALVRAMATALPGADARPGPDYLDCATRLAHPAARRARLLITHGFSGSGKSSLALQLVGVTGAVRIRSDVERKRLFGLDALARSAGSGLDLYGADATRRTFERLARHAHAALRAGLPVIVDAAFLRRAERRDFAALAARLGVPFAILDCRASRATLEHRVDARDRTRGDASEADVAVLARQIAHAEPLGADELDATIDIATDAAVDVAALAARWSARP